jgi:MFS family permease
MWASYYGRRTLGSIFGMSRAAQVVGFAVGPLASAVVFDRTGTYQGAFFSLALVAIAAALVLLMARRPALPNQAQQTQQ